MNLSFISINKNVAAALLFCTMFTVSLVNPVAAEAADKAVDTKASTSTPAVNEKSAYEFIKKLGDTALMSLTENGITRTQRESRVNSILSDNFDVDTIARFAMGPYWRDANDAQKAEYQKLFKDMIVVTYTTRFEDYSGQTLKVGNVVASGKRDYLVSSQIVQKGAPPINIDWRVRDKDGKLAIIDVIVEGISMSVTQRSDFASVIQRGGGDINSLLAMLRERNKKESSIKITE